MGPGHGTTLPLLLPFILYFLLALQAKAVYYPVREYSGSTFFDGWDFYGNVDNTTWGNVTYVNQTTAVSQGLAYVNSGGNAIMKVDNTTTIAPAPIVNRNSIRITSQDTVGAGNIILIDVKHIPYGCSVWPSFWTLGTGLWPNGGEIDIIEAINLMSNNQYALHTIGGCTLNTTGAQLTGKVYGTDCSTGSGCVIAETKPNSYGAGFAQAGGGVWATQLDVTGIYMWFWSRVDIPESITSATSNSTIDPSTWGAPSASYPATTCNYAQFFTPQQLVFTTTLCGVWAGVPNIYKGSCHTATGSCVSYLSRRYDHHPDVVSI
ncbi:glycoside hydrolase family 16 protein [Amanita rubescens]|nr:glycoside hydrolase family 16 protein [Amanita rubescens]